MEERQAATGQGDRFQKGTQEGLNGFLEPNL